MAGSSPFDILPFDRGDDAVWSSRITVDLPHAGSVLRDPIHKGHAWRANVGLQSTRLLLCGAPKSSITSTPPSCVRDDGSGIGDTRRPAWDAAGDMEWPSTNAAYTPTALAKDPHGSVWGQDVGPEGNVLHGKAQPPAIIEVHQVTSRQNVGVVARDVRGGLWLRGEYGVDLDRALAMERDSRRIALTHTQTQRPMALNPSTSRASRRSPFPGPRSWSSPQSMGCSSSTTTTTYGRLTHSTAA